MPKRRVALALPSKELVLSVDEVQVGTEAAACRGERIGRPNGICERVEGLHVADDGVLVLGKLVRVH